MTLLEIDAANFCVTSAFNFYYELLPIFNYELI